MDAIFSEDLSFSSGPCTFKFAIVTDWIVCADCWLAGWLANLNMKGRLGCIVDEENGFFIVSVEATVLNNNKVPYP